MSDEMKSVEAWAKEKSTPDWQLAAIIAANRLGRGAEMTEAEYDAAVGAFLGAPIR